MMVRSPPLSPTSEEDMDDMVSGDLGAGLGKKPGGLVYEAKESPAATAGVCKAGVGVPHDPSKPLSGAPAVNGCVGTRADRLADCELALEVLRHELEESHEDVEALRRQLEEAHEQMEEKDAIIQNLQSKAVFGIATSHCAEKVQRIEESKKCLEKEVNELRWEVESYRERLSNVEKLWLERYDRVCCENEALMASLELRAEEAKNLSAENMGLKRHRDELQASLSVRDKRTFLGSCSDLGQRLGCHSEVTPLELAVLGACRCEGLAGEPCGCAWATAAARRKIVELKSQLEELRRREEESVAVGDAYRIAFEQQLCRAATFAARLAPPRSVARRSPKHGRPTPAKPGGADATPAGDTGCVDGGAGGEAGTGGGGGAGERSPASVPVRFVERIARRLTPAARDGAAPTEPDPVELLTEMLSDKEEALAHQRRVSLILARRTTHLEQQLRELTGDGDSCGAPANSSVPGDNPVAGGNRVARDNPVSGGNRRGEGGTTATLNGGADASDRAAPADDDDDEEEVVEHGWARPDGWLVVTPALGSEDDEGGCGGERRPDAAAVVAAAE